MQCIVASNDDKRLMTTVFPAVKYMLFKCAFSPIPFLDNDFFVFFLFI